MIKSIYVRKGVWKKSKEAVSEAVEKASASLKKQVPACKSKCHVRMGNLKK